MPAFTTEQSRLVTTSLVILAAIAAAAALAYTRSIMVPFVLAVFISYLVSPVVDLLQLRFRVPRLAGVFVALLLGLVAVALLALLVTTSVRGLLSSADVYQEKLADLVARIFGVLDRMGLDLSQQSFLDAVRRLPIASFAQRTLGTVVGIVSKVGLVTIFVIYLVSARRPSAPRGGIYKEMDAKVRKYLVTKITASAATGILVGLILWLFRLDLALVFGITAFLLNFVPSIGSIVATLLPLPIALVQYDSLWPVLGVLLLPGLVQIVVGNGVEPMVMGEGLELHPVTILLALMFWGLLWGIPGMLLAAPMTAVLRIVLVRIQTTRPVAELLAGRLPAAATVTP
jgi:AI-2 transport protein TqsA